MTNVKCTCVICGDISLPISAITLRLIEGSTDTDGEYRFRCVKCGTINLKPAPVQIINLLYSNGCPTEVVEQSIEILERPRPEDAAPITLDDLIDLHAEMEDENWIQKLMGD